MASRISLDDLPASQPSVQRKVRHHIIGCEYLSGFCPENGSVRDRRAEAILWIHHLRTGKSRRSNLEGAPVERDLYTFTDADGTKRDDIENAFARTEADGGEITRRLAAGGEISFDEKYRYAAFIANMVIRTKAFHARLAETLRRDFRLTEVAPEQLHPYALMHMMKMGQIIFQMDWSVIGTSGGAGLLTSDNPVSITLWQPPNQPDPDCSILDKRVTLTFPLSMGACLIAEWRPAPTSFQLLDERHPLIALMNSERIASAHENIFAADPSLLLRPENATAVRLAHPRPSRLHSDDIELVPPVELRLPGVSDLMEQLLERMRESGLPTEPIRR